MDEFTNIWINKTIDSKIENYSLSFRVPYDPNFTHLPLVFTEVWQDNKNNHKSLSDCSVNEKEFHTNIPRLSRNQLIDLYTIIDKALDKKEGIIKLDQELI